MQQGSPAPLRHYLTKLVSVELPEYHIHLVHFSIREAPRRVSTQDLRRAQAPPFDRMTGTSWMFQQQQHGAGGAADAQGGRRKRRKAARAPADERAALAEQQDALGFLTRLSVRAPPATGKPRAQADSSDESGDEAGSGGSRSPKAVQPLAYAAVGALSVYYGIKGILGVRPSSSLLLSCVLPASSGPSAEGCSVQRSPRARGRRSSCSSEQRAGAMKPRALAWIGHGTGVAIGT